MPVSQFRREHILKELEKAGTVGVIDLAQSLSVSPMTIRRDLIELEQEGLVRRIYGGAVSNVHRAYEPPLALRSAQAPQAKQLIGKTAAQLVAEGDTVALDIGSTTFEVARNLVDHRNLTIITPSLHVANLFINQPEVRLILPGGIVRHGEASLVGGLTLQAFDGLFIDRLFLGVGCIDAMAELTEYNWEDTQIKQAMIKSAKEVIVVADSTKFSKVAFARICHFTAIHKLVTDRPPPDPISAKLNQANVKIILAC